MRLTHHLCFVLLVGIGDDHDSHTCHLRHHRFRRSVEERRVTLEALVQPLQHCMHSLTTQHLASLVATDQCHSGT
eukprot:COSAG06_NODE_20041_length_811_cov_1.501404_2_plen_75_part_00